MMRAGTAGSCLFSWFLLGCGGMSTTTPVSPSPTPASPNHAPEILSATVTPAVGVVGLTTFTAHVDARDPDGDPLSITWTDGDPLSIRWSDGSRFIIGHNADLTFEATDDLHPPLTVMVTDGKGGTIAAKVDYVAGDLNGFYDGFFGPDLHGLAYYMHLTRSGTTIAGTISDFGGTVGAIDPAEPGTIDGNGRIRIRFKFAPFGGDFVFEGRLVPYDKPLVGMFLANYAFTGRVIGGKFNGQTFTFGVHNPY
jgi:hypothetical protein